MRLIQGNIKINSCKNCHAEKKMTNNAFLKKVLKIKTQNMRQTHLNSLIMHLPISQFFPVYLLEHRQTASPSLIVHFPSFLHSISEHLSIIFFQLY